jgi:lipopolysaccharide transport system ATP-binding protein
MSAPVIQVENLSKAYRIGLKEEVPDTLVGAATSWMRAPLRNLNRLGRLNTHGSNGDSEDTLWALKDVSFEVQEGEVVGIIGRNGAGKSTLLKILSRITDPTSGRAIIRGRVSSLLEVGTGFHPELTGRENIYMNGTILGMRKREIDRKFDEIVDFSGVEKFLDTPIKRYSSGMTVRLAFAVAAHLEPEILIIDEVLAVGDIGFQKKCLGKMQEVANTGRTILFVSHNMAAVRSLCTRGVFFENGIIRRDDDAESVVSRYFEANDRIMNTHEPLIHGDEDRGTEYSIFFSDNNQNQVIDCGEELTIRFMLMAPKPLTEVTISITLYTPFGEKVVSTSSKVQNVTSAGTYNSPRWSIAALFGRLPLNSGVYHGWIYVGDGRCDVARFSNAFTLTVRPHDVFGWGNALPPAKDWGYIYWATNWEVAPEQNRQVI